MASPAICAVAEARSPPPSESNQTCIHIHGRPSGCKLLGSLSRRTVRNWRRSERGICKPHLIHHVFGVVLGAFRCLRPEQPAGHFSCGHRCDREDDGAPDAGAYCHCFQDHQHSLQFMAWMYSHGITSLSVGTVLSVLASPKYAMAAWARSSDSWAWRICQDLRCLNDRSAKALSV
ncbi:hypothetical protein PS854_02035 [Pseudomonas fluorescens]|uniref:Uncharacterized protein n=1 Tax=Pseudomonas fluorescens TaxID=294 RepID=A0A5E7J9Y6_PSEFL|nr:hypothetical protein PS854_02035 [Pseudomonas fluorescens]